MDALHSSEHSTPQDNIGNSSRNLQIKQFLQLTVHKTHNICIDQT